MPTIGQILVLLGACLAFAAGGGISLARLWTDHPGQRLMAKICLYVGIGLTVAVLIWHSASRGAWLPLEGNFERLVSVTVGFARLTIGLITGFARIVKEGGETRLGPHWFSSPKVILTIAVWVVYALVLHSPINPSFRGRKAAILSIVGFFLMISTIVAEQLMPGGTGGQRCCSDC